MSQMFFWVAVHAFGDVSNKILKGRAAPLAKLITQSSSKVVFLI
jgi:hypothetical protein